MEQSNLKATYGCLFLIAVISGAVLMGNGNDLGWIIIAIGVAIWLFSYFKPKEQEQAKPINLDNKPNNESIAPIDFDDIHPEDDEVEYRIVGINYRNLSAQDVGYSDNFSIKADTANPHDQYAIEIYNARGSLSGYLERPDNEFWFKFLTKAKNSAPWMQCRGYIGIFENDRGEYKYYGKIYLPEIEQDEDYHKIMN